MRFWNGDYITELKPSHVFCYGANPEFRNGKGAALAARSFGAKPYGGGRGIVGQTYGLVTKNLKAGFSEKLPDGSIKVYEKAGERSVSEEDIIVNICELYDCCDAHSDKQFIVVYQNNGINLNGYSSMDIFDMFVTAARQRNKLPSNIYFHSSFRGLIQ